MAVNPISTQLNPDVRTHDDARDERAEQSFDFLERWRMLSERKWSILGLTLSITVLAMLVVFSIQPTYRATVTVLIEAQKNNVVGIEEVYSGISANREYYQTQVEVMKSRELAAKVVNRLDLTKHREFDPRQQEPSLWP
jgi:succinoglycan biosynthesis transport protein ExoP